VNPRLELLHPYPFEKLRELFAGVTTSSQRAIRLSIGEPQHATPDLITDALRDGFAGLSVYPSTSGSEELRQTIAHWLQQRYALSSVNHASQVLPVTGSREALFSFAQAVIDSSKPAPLVVCPNPFYQIYEGAALLAGATPVFVNQTPENGFGFDWTSLSSENWRRVQLLYICSPGNPTGRVMLLDEWKALFELSDRYGFVIAADECYSEIYFDESTPPLGALQAAELLGRSGFPRLVVFSSLSKRSNVPGMRSGFVAGDASILNAFLRYRTYHGCAMGGPIQSASIAAWRDETHVRHNRSLYRDKFSAVVPLLSPVLDVSLPDAGFYLWARVPGGNDAAFAKALLENTNVTVLPGQYLARNTDQGNPGEGFIRIALVAPIDDCIEAAQRIAAYLS
jgi:N-succinyldiaminopimelate aminotransferase